MKRVLVRIFETILLILISPALLVLVIVMGMFDVADVIAAFFDNTGE